MLDMFALAGHRKALRPHQEKALALLRHSMVKRPEGNGHKRVVLQGPTGFGKTLVAAKIIEGALTKGNRVIFTTPAISLIDQTVAAFEAEGIADIGVMQSKHPRTNPLARVQVATVQTLAQREVPEAALVIVDEVHIQSRRVDALMDERPDVYFIGLSATPWRPGMGERWQDLLVPVTIGELIDGGYLSRFVAYAPDVPDLSGVRIKAGEYAEDGLEAVMGDAKLMGSVVETWLAKGEDRPTLMFGVNRAHAQRIQAEFLRAGVSAGYCDAFTDLAERARLRRQFLSGEVRVACSVRTLTTGVDWPVSCIIDAAPTRSDQLHVQKIGRGLRVNPGTEDLIVLDHAGNSLRLGLVTDIRHRTFVPAVKGKAAASRKPAEKLPKACGQCGVLSAGVVCPSCGHERKPSGRVETVDGDLVQISGRKAAPTMAEKQRFWAMALWLDRERGKGGRLAKGLYKGKYGVWPRGLSDVPMAPDAAFVRYEHSRRIAYAKRMAKERDRAGAPA